MENIKTYKRKSVFSELKTFDFLAKENDFIEITEWHNGEGYDININDRQFHLSYGELEAINFLIKKLEYNL